MPPSVRRAVAQPVSLSNGESSLSQTRLVQVADSARLGIRAGQVVPVRPGTASGCSCRPGPSLGRSSSLLWSRRSCRLVSIPSSPGTIPCRLLAFRYRFSNSLQVAQGRRYRAGQALACEPQLRHAHRVTGDHSRRCQSMPSKCPPTSPRSWSRRLPSACPSRPAGSHSRSSGRCCP